MVKRTFLALASFFIFAAASTAEEHTTEVDILKGEKWWGLTYTGSEEQPLTYPFDNDKVAASWDKGIFRPVMVSNTGRYICSKAPFTVDFGENNFTISSGSEKVTVEKSGKSLREAYVLCALKNFPPDRNAPSPEMFSMPMYETAYELGHAQGEDEIVAYAEKLLAEGFPAGIIVIADGWQKVNGAAYEFDPELYGDPKNVADRLHGLGFRVMLTVTPFVPKWGRIFTTALRDGQLLEEHLRNGAAEYAILDMGNEAQFERIRAGFEKIKSEYGFDGFRFECGEGMPADSKHVQNFMGLGEGLNFVSYRGGLPRTYMMGTIASGNMNDNMYATMVGNVVTAGLMGYPYMQTVSHTPLILTDQRSMADFLLMQCGMPVVSVDFAPWRITDAKLYESVKAGLNFRASIRTYVEQLVKESQRTGEPLARHMEYQFPKSGFADCTDQFMLGTKYLFAPCVDGSGKRMVRFPKGTWTDHRNGTKFRGPVVKQVDCSAGGLICFELSR